MSYRLISFGDTSLKGFDETDDMGSGKAAGSYQRLPSGGAIDNFGEEQSFVGVVNRGKNLISIKSTSSLLQTQINEFKKLIGVRARLVRRDLDGVDNYVNARLLQVRMETSTENRRKLANFIQPVKLVFMAETDIWIGDSQGDWALNDGFNVNDFQLLNGGLIFNITSDSEEIEIEIVDNAEGGKTVVKSVVLGIVAPVGGLAPGLEIENQLGQKLVFGAAVAAGELLLINSGNSTIFNNVVDAWDDLTITYGDYPTTWFALDVGVNTITITNGNGIELDVRFAERLV